jgi:endonuclease/exonuclease/phosphatase family metal-dependent hydrolase
MTVSDETYVATARVNTQVGQLDLVSLHVYPGKKQYDDLDRIVELASSLAASNPFVMGGDFNAQRKYGPRNARFFEAMQRRGAHDAYFGKHGEEGWSFWGRQAKEKYQDDHFFVTESWSCRVASCEIINEGLVRTVSDHGPVVLELDTAST